MRKLRQKARLKEHQYGQGILGLSDVYRRAAPQHDCVKAIVQKPDCTNIIMQTEQQACLSGKPRYIQADSQFGVVAAGSVKEGVDAAAIQAADKRALEWDLFNFVYVCSSVLCLVGHRRWGGRSWRGPVADGEVLKPYGTSAGFGSAPTSSTESDKGMVCIDHDRHVHFVITCSCVSFLYGRQGVCAVLEQVPHAFPRHGHWQEHGRKRGPLCVTLPRGGGQRVGRAAGAAGASQ